MKKKKQEKPFELPNTDMIEGELNRERYKEQYGKSIRSTFRILVIVAAIVVLITTLLFPVLHIYGSSMTPALEEGNIVVCVKGLHYKQGDVLGFYYNNKILIKRVIATSGDWVDIKEDGTVYVNKKPIDEPYLTEKALGDCNITLPYQVPDARIFVMGDHRSISVDSRNASIGCVAEEQIVGKIVFRVWPLTRLGTVR